MMRPPTIAPGNRIEAAQDQHRQRLERNECQRVLDAVARAPEKSGNQSHRAGHAPHDRPDLLQRDADGQRRLMVIGHGAQCPPDSRATEKQCEHGHQDCGHSRGHEVELRNVHSRPVGHPLDGFVLQPQFQAAHVGAPDHLRQALDEEREADRRHEQCDLRLIDERSQHHAFNAKSQHDHDDERYRYGQPGGEAVLQQPDVGECGKKHHRALREVEYAGGLVDQDEAERHERVHHAREKAADQDFEEK